MGNLIALIQCSMQKIYLLLRNNQQSGPFTREELLQQVLRKDDLVWVEGKSAGWRNPEEIAELKTEPETAPGPPVADTGKAEKPADAVPARKSNHVYISLPSGMTRITEPTTTAAPAPAGLRPQARVAINLEAHWHSVMGTLSAYAETNAPHMFMGETPSMMVAAGTLGLLASKKH